MFPGVEGRAGMPSNSSGANATAAASSAAAALVSQLVATASAFAIYWDFDSSITMGDPGTGKIRLNNATLASVTAIAVSALTLSSGNPDLSAWIAQWGASSHSPRGYIVLKNAQSEAFVAVYSVTAAVTDNGTWLQITVSHVASAGSVSAGNDLVALFTASGTDGSGDVTGPASSTDNAIARFDLATGKLLQNSTVTIDDSGNVDGVLNIAFDGTPNTDHTSIGPTTNTFVSAGSTTVMDLVYLDGTSQWVLTDADAAATAGPVKLAISLETKTAGQAMKVALPGSFVRDDTWAWTPGAVLYVSETAGQISASVPTGVDGIVRIVGYAVTADVIFFNPSDDYITIDASGNIKNVSGITPASSTNTDNFRAYRGTAQTLSDAVWTKVQFATEVFDANSWYDSATNYRFTPLVAGKYLVALAIRLTSTANIEITSVAIYKNGAVESTMSNYGVASASNDARNAIVTSIIDMNGSTDYLEGYCYHDSTTGVSADVTAGASLSFFCAARVGT